MKLKPAKTPKRPPNVAKTNIKFILSLILLLLYFYLNSFIILINNWYYRINDANYNAYPVGIE